MYIISTDQGYISSGEIHKKLTFSWEKEDAKQFKEVPYQWVEDLSTYYCCEQIDLELIN